MHRFVPDLIVLVWLTAVMGISFSIWFDWETVRFFVQPRPDQYRWLAPWFGGWVDLSDYGISAASLTLRPLMTWTFQIESLLFGAWAPGYHILNFAAHTACVFLFIRFLARLGLQCHLTWIMGLIFGLHPLSTQPLWILGDRAEVCVLLGGLIALNGYASRRSWVVPGLLLAFYSKETAITIPAWLIAYDLVFLDRNTNFICSVKNRIKRLFVPFLITLGYLIHRSAAFSGAGGYRSVDHFSFSHLPAVLSQNIAWLLTFPHSTAILPALFFALAVLAFSLRKMRVSRFAIIWLCLFLIPVHNLANKWYLYTPAAAMTMILAGFCNRVRHASAKKWLAAGLLAIVSLLSVLSYAELRQQKRNANLPFTIATCLKSIRPELDSGTHVHFVLPHSLTANHLKGHYFNPASFHIKSQKNPIESIVWDLNSTRFTDDLIPVWTRSVEAALRLEYNDISLRASLADMHEPHRAGSDDIRINYNPGNGSIMLQEISCVSP